MGCAIHPILEPILGLRGVSRSFVGLQALQQADFRRVPGEVHALTGQNGAGKSTLIKVPTGVFRHHAPREQRVLAQRLIGQLGIVSAVAETPIGQLSGGTQQKAILARWLVAGLQAQTAWLKQRSALGLFIPASGGNPAAARLAGLNARGLPIGVYAFCGLTAGPAGPTISSNVKSADGNHAGLLLELDAILAVTLGGTSLLGGRFSLRGSVLQRVMELLRRGCAGSA